MKLDAIHEHYVKNRRIDILSARLAELYEDGPRSVLDVGCGDGQIASRVMALKSGLKIQGIDPLVRPDTAIEVTAFDGQELPFADESFDYVQFVDVLHHTEDPMVLLREGCRVARRGIVLKDHLVKGLAARQVLRFMDGVGNQRFGVSLPHNYWTPTQWKKAFELLKLNAVEWNEQIALYPWWANWIFGRNLHVIAKLMKVSA
jgi:SAM-dependent methyltransferase